VPGSTEKASEEKTQSQHCARLFDLTSEFLCVLRRDGTMAMPNEAWERFLGFSPEEFGSLSFFDLLHPDDQARIVPAGNPAGEGCLILDVKGRVRCADGVYRVAAWSLFPAPEPGTLYALGHEAAELDSETDLTAEIERLYRDIDTLAAMRDNLDMCVTIEEASQVIRRFCSKAMDGFPGEVWISNASRNLMGRVARWGDGDEDMLGTMEPVDCWALRGGRPHSYDPQGSGLSCKHHKPLPSRSICIPLKGSNEVLGLLTTWERRGGIDRMWPAYLRRVATTAEVLAMGLANLTLRETLRSQSIRDPLTALFNRRYMEESLDRELARATRHESTVGLIMLDIDSFKHFNDEFGHRAGDTALVLLANLLSKTIRTEDVACRYGGEEFAVIMPGSPLEATIRRASAIGEAVREIAVREDDGKALAQLTVSMGVSVFPDHGATSEDLVRAADLALYAAKQGGRDCLRVATAGDSDAGPAQAD